MELRRRRVAAPVNQKTLLKPADIVAFHAANHAFVAIQHLSQATHFLPIETTIALCNAMFTLDPVQVLAQM